MIKFKVETLSTGDVMITAHDRNFSESVIIKDGGGDENAAAMNMFLNQLTAKVKHKDAGVTDNDKTNTDKQRTF